MKIKIVESGKEQYRWMHEGFGLSYTDFKKNLKRKIEEHRLYVETNMPSVLSKEIETEMVKDISIMLKFIHRHFVLEPENFDKDFIHEYLKMLKEEK